MSKKSYVHCALAQIAVSRANPANHAPWKELLSRDENGSGLDRTAFFIKLADQDGIGLRKFLF